MSGDQEELQQLSQQLEAIESQLEALHTELQQLRVRQSDMEEAVEALETLETGSTVQVPLGGGTYVRATVEDMDEVIVGIGGSYAAERKAGTAMEVLEDRKDRLAGRIEDLTESIAELESQGEELGQEAQQRLQRLEQQQQQSSGMGGLGTGQNG